MAPESAFKKYKKLLQKRDNLVRAIMHHADIIKQCCRNTFASASGHIHKIWRANGRNFRRGWIWFQSLRNKQLKSNWCIFEHSHDDKRNNKRHHEYWTFITDVKLPALSIPTFDGNELEWTTFYDTFSSLVDQNASIPKINKMHYLRDSLKGDAFRSISKLPASEVNYDIAWKLLQEQYHNNRSIVNDCLKSFIFQEKLLGMNSSFM